MNLGVVYHLSKEYDKASGSLESALAIVREMKSRDLEASVLGALMDLWAKRRQPRLAIILGKKSINILQEIRSELRDLDPTLQQSFVQTKKSTYRELADLLAGQGRLAEAQQALDLLKQDEFSKFVLRDRNVSSNEGRVTLTSQEAEWEQRYQSVADRLTSVGVKRGALLAKLDRTVAEEKELATLELDLEAGNRAFQTFLNSLETTMGDRRRQ